MYTLSLTIRLPDDLHELLIAELAELGLDAFEREDEAVIAYGPPSLWNGVARETVERWLRARGLPDVVEERLFEPENWNARWEATIEPLAVGRFVVAPTWAEVSPALAGGRAVLRIDPKMSFGTGYHASTRLALRFLPGLVHDGDRALDAGTGTGVLAIAAITLGAAEALGFDVDPWAVTNATENAVLNGVDGRFEVREGGLEVVAEVGFDLICANIQLDVLRGLVPLLAEKLAAGGRLLLAGLLTEQRTPMLETASAAGLALCDELAEGEWWACACTRA